MKRIAVFRSGREHYSNLFNQLINENIAVTDITTICALSDIYIELMQDSDTATMLLKGLPFSEFDQFWFLGMPLPTTNIYLDECDSNFSNIEWYALLMSFFAIAKRPIKGLGSVLSVDPLPLGKYRSRLILAKAGWHIETIKHDIIFGPSPSKIIEQNNFDMWSVIFTEKEWFLIENDFVQFEDMSTFSTLCWRTWVELKGFGRIWYHLRFYVKNDMFYADGIYDDLPQNQSDIRKIVLDALY